MSHNLTLGSLFDGSGGFPLAGSLCGITPKWCSEIEPYPIAVTCSRFPDMKHYGDVSKINGAEVEPVDIITFGSPCQDLSVAGKRAGLKHEANGDEETTRSGLFMEAVRIIKEMREATNGVYPRFALWENVPGAFSSNKGEDFRVVLEELIKVVEPTCKVPPAPKGGWPYADAYMGPGWSIAYRVFDAQYWGVPQRRRRIHLIADFTGECAADVLFEREGVRGYFAESGTPWQGSAGDAENSAGADDRVGKCFGIDHVITTGGNCTAQGPCVYEDIQATLKAFGPHAVGYSIENHPAVIGTFQNTGVGWWNESTIGATVRTPCGGDSTMANVSVEKHAMGYIVRRLIPTECARLQGFADRWGDIDPKEDFTEEEYRFWLEVRNTHAAINGKTVKDYTKAQMLTWYNKLNTDSAEYKMWGNGIALPPALYVMQGIVEAVRKAVEI